MSIARRLTSALLLCAASWAVLACDLGPLGATALRGEAASAPVADWSWLEPRYSLEIEPHAKAILPAAHVWFIVQDGALWLYAMSTSLEAPWLARLRSDPRLSIRVDGTLHAARAMLVTDPAALEPLLPRLLAKYHLIRTSHARFVPHPERYPATQVHHWFFRVEADPERS